MKDEAELDAAAQGVRDHRPRVRALTEVPFVGRTEREVSWELVRALPRGGRPGCLVRLDRRLRADRRAAACACRRPQDRAGELVVIDTGTSLGGYTPTTRGPSRPGRSTRRRRRRTTPCSARSRPRSTASARASPASTRTRSRAASSTRARSAGRLGHGLGHGLGLDIHEAPRLSTESTDTLVPGNVVTVEPGIYLEGRFGIRDRGRRRRHGRRNREPDGLPEGPDRGRLGSPGRTDRLGEVTDMSRRTLAGLTACLAVSATFAALAATAWADDPLPRAITHEHWNGYEALLKSTDSTSGIAQYKNPSSPICSTTTSTAANVATDCEGIALRTTRRRSQINPTNPNNMIARRKRLPARGQHRRARERDDLLSHAHVNRRRWPRHRNDVPDQLPTRATIATGDPAVAFDATGRAYHHRRSASASARALRRGKKRRHPRLDLQTDSGQTWTTSDPRSRAVAAPSGSVGHLQRQGVHRRLGRRKRDRPPKVALQRTSRRARTAARHDLRVGHARRRQDVDEGGVEISGRLDQSFLRGFPPPAVTRIRTRRRSSRPTARSTCRS